MTVHEELLDDLGVEHHDLRALVEQLPDAAWDLPTRAAGWRVRDQVVHLLHFDEVACLAMHDPEGLAGHRRAAQTDVEAYEADHVERASATTAAGLLSAWCTAFTAMPVGLRSRDAGDHVEWYGPPMSSMSFATARLMEVWAHGDDIAVAVGVRREPTTRLRHVVHLGVITRGWSFRVRGLEPPPEDVRVALLAPDRSTWAWGPEGAAQSVTGPAEDFARVVTQRVALDDTALVVCGEGAVTWMRVARAFAGRPTLGPRRADADRA
jgi:uncharacterized protein (TIGR03084 family)